VSVTLTTGCYRLKSHCLSPVKINDKEENHMTYLNSIKLKAISCTDFFLKTMTLNLYLQIN